MLSGKVVYSDRAINFNLTGPDCKLDDLGTGFEIAEGNILSHSWIANCQTSWRQGGLF